MRWPWQRRPEPHATPGDGDVEERAARVDEALQKAHADTPVVEKLAAQITNRIEENTWSPKIAAAFQVAPIRRRGHRW